MGPLLYLLCDFHDQNFQFLELWIIWNRCVNLACFGDICIRIKTHDSESRGQEEAGLCDERVSYLCIPPP